MNPHDSNPRCTNGELVQGSPLSIVSKNFTRDSNREDHNSDTLREQERTNVSALTQKIPITLWKETGRDSEGNILWSSRAEAQLELSIDEFLNHMISPEEANDKHALTSFSPGRFKDNHRKKEKAYDMGAVLYDYDKGSTQPDNASLLWKDNCGALYSTFNNTTQKPRFRIVLPLSRLVTNVEYEKIWSWGADKLRAMGHVLDEGCKDPSRLWFGHGYPPECKNQAFAFRWEGVPLPVDDALKQSAIKAPKKTAPAQRASTPIDDREDRARKYVRKVEPAIQGQGGSDKAYRAACVLVHGFDLDVEAAITVFTEEYNPLCVPPWNDKEIKHKVESANKVEDNQGRSRGYLLNEPDPITSRFQEHIKSKQNKSSPIEQEQKSYSINSHIIDQADWLPLLNREYAFISLEGKARILHLIDNPPKLKPPYEFMSVADFKEFKRNYKTTGTKNELRDVAPLWLACKDRREYNGIVFDPSNQTSKDYFNLWQGFAVQPKKGDCSLFKKHLFEVICARNKTCYEYLWNWLADAVQRPTEKPGVAVALQSDAEGTGKGVFCSYFGSIFGRSYKQVFEPDHIIGKFNGILEGVLVCNADEACWADSNKAAKKLKGMITEPVLNIERKGLDPIPVENLIRFIFTSNKKHLVPAGTHDRRYFVLTVSPHKVGDRAYFTALLDECKNEGAGALLYELLHTDLSSVELRDVPQTKALLEQKLHSLEPEQRFWFHCLFEGEIVQGVSWSAPHEKSKVFEAFSNFTKNSRKTDIRAFGKTIIELAPGTVAHKKANFKDNDYSIERRANAYLFPSLEACREAFSKLLAGDIDWPSIEN